MTVRGVCKNCGSDFYAKSRKANYCSSGCKQDAYRKRKGIATPGFLMDGAKEGGLGVLPSDKGAGSKPLPKRFSSEYLRLKMDLDRLNGQIELVGRQHQNELLKISKLIEENPKLGILLGASGGALLASAFQKEDKEANWLQILCGAVAGGVVGHILQTGVEQSDWNVRELQKKFNRYYDEAGRLSKKKDALTLERNILENRLKATPKYESKTEQPPKVSFKPVDLLELAPVKQKTPSLNAVQIQDMEFETWRLKGEFGELLGNPEIGFSMIVYGKPGQGKSTYCLKFADYLASNFGKTIYVSSEMGISSGLQNILNRTGSRSEDLSFIQRESFEDFSKRIQRARTPFVFLDSVNDLGWSPEQLERLKRENKKKSFVYIFQATKSGDFRGANSYAHNADIVLKMEGREPFVEKTRF